MFALLGAMRLAHVYTPRCYVVAATDRRGHAARPARWSEAADVLRRVVQWQRRQGALLRGSARGA